MQGFQKKSVPCILSLKATEGNIPLKSHFLGSKPRKRNTSDKGEGEPVLTGQERSKGNPPIQKIVKGESQACISCRRQPVLTDLVRKLKERSF